MDHRRLRMRSPGRQWRRVSHRGVADVVATILLLALTVTLFASIFAFVTNFPSPPSQNNNQFQASLVLTSAGTNISSVQITHLAGPSVPGSAQVYLKSATQPFAPEFQSPYTVASQTLTWATVTGFKVWNLGQVWTLTFSTSSNGKYLPSSNGNITIYVVASSQLVFSVILPGTLPIVPPTVLSTWISPANPVTGQAFTVFASISGTYTTCPTNCVELNLAYVPGGASLPNGGLEPMVPVSQGWSYAVPTGTTTSNGTFYAFVNASNTAGASTTGVVAISIARASGTQNVAAITVLPVTGAAGAGISPGVTGANFGPAGSVDSVTLSLYGIVLTPVFTGLTTGACPGSGTTIQIQVGVTTFTCGFTVPSGLPYGALILVANDATSGQAATATFTSNPPLASANAPAVTPPPVSQYIDLGQTPTAATDTLPGVLGGTGTVSYTWQVSYNSGAYATATATQCATPSGAASNGEVLNCVVGATLATGTYNYEIQLTDSASPAATTTSSASATVTVSSALTAPSAPGVSAAKLDVDQVLTVQGTIPSTGTSTYSWQWQVSVNGAAYVSATQCAANSGSGAIGGAAATCSIAGSTLVAGDTYAFKLQVTDSATTAETMTSAASSTVTVASKLTVPAKPTVATVTTTQTVTGVIPSSGTSTYSWQWWVNIGGAGFVKSTICSATAPSANSGTGAVGGATETCKATGLSTTTTYAWELQVTDSATAPESTTSPATTATDGRPMAAPALTECPSSAPVSGIGFTGSPPATQIVSDGMAVPVSRSAFFVTADGARDGASFAPASDRSLGG